MCFLEARFAITMFFILYAFRVYDRQRIYARSVHIRLLFSLSEFEEFSTRLVPTPTATRTRRPVLHFV